MARWGLQRKYKNVVRILRYHLKVPDEDRNKGWDSKYKRLIRTKNSIKAQLRKR